MCHLTEQVQGTGLLDLALVLSSFSFGHLTHGYNMTARQQASSFIPYSNPVGKKEEKLSSDHNR